MSIKISYKKQINEKLIKNYVLFSDDNFKIHSLNEMALANKASFIKEIIKKNESKKSKFLAFNINSIQRIILISFKKKTNSLENEKIGADFYNFIKSNSFFNLTLIEKNIRVARKNNSNILEEFLHGAELKSYEFNKYKSKKKNLLIKINISVSKKLQF